MRLTRRLGETLTRWLPAKPMRSRLRGPVASFTFDDFPKSAWSVGGPILAQHRVAATYYTSGSRCGTFADGAQQYDREDLAAVAAAGHEIGCHSFAHAEASTLSDAELEADMQKNLAFLRETLGDVSLSSFAYPNGDVSPRTKLFYARAFPTSRGIHGGINAGVLDLAQLKIVSLSNCAREPGSLQRWLEQAKAKNGWVIFITHDVTERPEHWGCTPQMLDEALTESRRAGLEILPVKSALARACI